MKKRRCVSIILTLVLMMGIVLGNSKNIRAADELPCVDGSYLTEDDYSEVTVGSMTRGVYLRSGSSAIAKSGTGRISARGNTVGQTTVSKISVTVRVQRLVNGSWQSYTSWSATEYNSPYVSSSKTLIVPTGYYYRVYSTHTANSDSSGSFTDGIYI